MKPLFSRVYSKRTTLKTEVNARKPVKITKLKSDVMRNGPMSRTNPHLVVVTAARGSRQTLKAKVHILII